jgi:hypothetical protein
VLEGNLGKIANWIEKVGNVQEVALASFLVSLGMAPADAAIAAHYKVTEQSSYPFVIFFTKKAMFLSVFNRRK